MIRPIPVAWHSGAFSEGARFVVAFNIDNVSVSRPDAPVTSENVQGRKSLQAAPVGIASPVPPQQLDQARWSNFDTEWRHAKAVWGPKVH
jgi:hypothetical protein